jgi:hypothetical protein
MDQLVEKLKKILHENKEDLQYLLNVGLPTGILLILLSRCCTLGEVY